MKLRACLFLLIFAASVYGQGAPNTRAATLAWNWTYPTNIAGLQFWVKAGAVPLNDGDAMDTWSDNSGKGRPAMQGIVLNQPVLKTGILNGKAVVRFDQVSDRMATVGFGLAQPCQVFIVTKYNQARLGNDTWFDGLTTASLMRAFRPGIQNLSINAGASLASVAGTPESFHVWSLTYNGTMSVNRWDGGFQSLPEGNAGTANADGITLNTTGAGLLWGGQDMAEMIVYSPPLSKTDRDKIERYLSGKFALPLQH